MSQDPQDFICREWVSDCCGAAILAPDFCADCREHCVAELVTVEEPDPTLPLPFSTETPTP